MAISIRVRLALVYTAVLSVVLLGFGVALYVAVGQYLARTTDAAVAGIAGHVASALAAGERLDSGSFLFADLDPFAAPGVHVQILDANGTPTAHSAGLGIKALPTSEDEVQRALAGTPTYYTAPVRGERVRVYNLPLQRSGRTVGVVQVGKSYHDYDLALAQLGEATASGAVLALIGAGLIGWAVAGRALRPVAAITATAHAIAQSQSFERRLPTQLANDEVGQMAQAFNEMLDSLQAAYAAQRRFVADASHELRAPLTTIKGNLEFLLRAPDLPPAERTEALADALAEASRMGRLVNDLLALARADSGQQLNPQPVALANLLADLWQESLPRAGGVQLTLGRLDDVMVWGDPDRLRQLAVILIDNALKYTPAGGRVEISLLRRRDCAELRVADTGIGIDPEDLPHIFARFFRADKARARDDGGVGLGLAIAKAVVDLHGGTIEAASTPGQGSVFTVTLPSMPGRQG